MTGDDNGTDGGSTTDECDGENGGTTDDRRLTDVSICVKPKTCVIRFEPGHTYARSVQLSNTTARPQIIRVTRSPPEGEIFKFSDPTAFQATTIPPGGSWNLQFTFRSHSDREYKCYLHLKNPTGRANLRDVELRAVPKTHSSFPRAINFGNVDIGMSVSRKFCLAPESNPYQFRIFIPYGFEGLRVNPTCGQVLSDSPVDVTVVYTPQLCITLRTDLVLYLSGGNQGPRIITLTAVTKPKTNRITTISNNKRTTTKVFNIPPIPRPLNRNKAEKDIVIFNRLTLNKMLAEKQAPSDNHYSWLNPLGEFDDTYRESYAQCCDDFVAEAKRFGDEHKEAGLIIPRCELEVTDEQRRSVTEEREAEWNVYEDASTHDFDPNLDDNWSVRLQSYNKFVTAVKTIIIKNRLKKRLDGLKAISDNSEWSERSNGFTAGPSNRNESLDEDMENI